mgnify:CR=1 FL=1|jgi:type II secretory pathway component PulF|tara:strand:- start:239 stop:1318 length:1080 start_codon:yes stop_codon:yes gene_type:complete
MQELIYSIQEFVTSLYQGVLRRLSFNRKRQAALLKTLAKPMKVGRPPVEIVKHLIQFGDNQQKVIAKDMLHNLRSGVRLTSALEGWYDEVTISALRAAEQSGQNTFVDALDYLGDKLTEASKAKMAIFAKWLYPAVFVVGTSALILGLNDFMVPTILAMNNDQPPPNVQSFMDVADFYLYRFPIIAVLFVAGLVYARWWFANHVGPIRDTIDHIKLFSGYRLSIGANVVSTFALLKRFDMKPLRIVQMLEETGSPYQQSHVFNMKEALKGGREEQREGNKGIVNALDIGLLDDIYVSLLKLYAQASDEFVVEALELASEDIHQRVMERLGFLGMWVTLALWAWIGFNVITIVSLLMGIQ